MPAADGTGATVCVTARFASPGFGIQLTIAPPEMPVNAEPSAGTAPRMSRISGGPAVQRVVRLHVLAGRRRRRERQAVHREVRHQPGIVDRELHRVRARSR